LLNNQADFDSAIRRFDPSRPSQLILLIKIAFSIASFGKADSAARRRRRRYVGSPPFTPVQGTQSPVRRLALFVPAANTGQGFQNVAPRFFHSCSVVLCIASK
jgi:hypothetical protein